MNLFYWDENESKNATVGSFGTNYEYLIFLGLADCMPTGRRIYDSKSSLSIDTAFQLVMAFKFYW